MNPTCCITPDGKVLNARNPRRLAGEIVRDVNRRSAAECHRLLVDDAVKRRITDWRWAVAAYVRIGGGDGAAADRAMVAVLDDVEAETGLRLMPGVLL